MSVVYYYSSTDLQIYQNIEKALKPWDEASVSVACNGNIQGNEVVEFI